MDCCVEKNRCVCEAGLYRNSAGICVPEDECNQVCGVNEQWNECGSPCGDLECGQAEGFSNHFLVN